MARIRINTRTHTKEKPYLINSYFFKIGKAKKKSIGWAKYVYVCEWDMCWRIFCNFSLATKKCEKKVKNSPFFKWAPVCNLISKKGKELCFSEVNNLNYTKGPNFACGNYIFPETRGNKNKPWTHSTPLNGSQLAKMKSTFLTCPCHKIYKDEAVGLKSYNYTFKITIFVNVWNLVQFLENLIFFNNYIIKIRLQKSFCTYMSHIIMIYTYRTPHVVST